MVYDRTLWRNLIHVTDLTEWGKTWLLCCCGFCSNQAFTLIMLLLKKVY